MSAEDRHDVGSAPQGPFRSPKALARWLGITVRALRALQEERRPEAEAFPLPLYTCETGDGRPRYDLGEVRAWLCTRARRRLAGPFHNVQALARFLGLSGRTLRKLMRERPDFPRAVCLSATRLRAGMPVYDRAEVLAWLARLPRERTDQHRPRGGCRTRRADVAARAGGASSPGAAAH